MEEFPSDPNFKNILEKQGANRRLEDRIESGEEENPDRNDPDNTDPQTT